MADYDKMFGNMSSEEYEIWATMSPEEKRKLANEIASEKRKEEKARQDQANAEDRAFRASAMRPAKAPEVKEEIFNEMYGPDSTYAKIAKESAKEIMGGDEPVIRRSGHPTVRKVQSMTSDAGGSIISNPTHPAVQLKNKKIAEEDAIADARMESALQQDDPDLLLEKPSYISQRVWDDLPISQRRKVLANIERTESKADLLSIPESEVFDEVYTEDSPEGLSAKAVAKEMSSIITPRDQSPPENIPDSREEYVEKVNKMVEEGKITEEEANRVLKGNERFPIITPRDQRPPENIPDSRDEYVEKVKKLIAEGKLDANSPEVGRILGSGYDPEAELIASEYEAEGLMNVKRADNELENAIKNSKKKSTTGWGKFDKNGYPIYEKGSEWGNKFKNRFNEAVKNGESIFKWAGHDGIERSYTNDISTETETIKSKKKYEGTLEHEGRVPPISTVKKPGEFIARYVKSTEKEKPKLLKLEVDKATNIEDKKTVIGETKESDDKGPDRYFVDPFTGWAMCLTCADRRKDRKQIMELAKTLPADTRAAYYFSKGLIKQADFDLVTKDQKLKDAMARKLTQLKIDEAGWKIISAKAEAEKDPKRKEYLSMFLNASTNKNYELLSHLGEKLGLDEDLMKKVKKSQLAFEMAKINSKATKGGLKKAFSDNFGVDYKTVISNKLNWIDKATAIIQTTGRMEEYNLNGKIVRDRSGRFRTYGLKEQSDMQELSYAEQLSIVQRSPYLTLIKSDTRFHNNKGEFDVSKLVNNTDAYEQYLKKDLVYFAMNDAYNEEYGNMMKYIAKFSFDFEKDEAGLKKVLTANAALTEKGNKKRPNSELKL